MKNIHRIRKLFVRQMHENDCGIACLGMILNYAGMSKEMQLLREQSVVTESGVSLLQLKRKADELEITAKCVKMDIDHLRLIDRPTILHMIDERGNNHYQVCFGCISSKNVRLYLMADPAHQVHYLSETALREQWESQTALVFDDLTEKTFNWKTVYGAPLFTLTRVPRWLYLSLALLSIFTAFFGIALTWVLQSGINDPLAGKKNSIVWSTVILLLIISLFKSLLGYVKQQIMVTVSLQINEQLTLKFMTSICSSSLQSRMQISQSSIKAIIGDIQKIQNAISLFMGTLVADGTLVLISVLGLFYLVPFSAGVTVTFLTASIVISVKNLPALLYQNSSLTGLAGDYERSLLQLVHGSPVARERLDVAADAPHTKIHNRYIRFARTIANKFGRINLLSECLGTLNVIMVISLGLFSLRNERISYTDFMLAVILTYFITTLMNKICSTLYAIFDGSDAAIQFKHRSSD